MIELRQGDILKAKTEALVNTVNCVGVMGRGIALQFRRAYPGNYKAYQAACKRGEVRPGEMFTFETGHLANPRYIVNFPTKRHWRGRSKLSDIDAGLRALVSDIKRLGIRSIAIPPLGCGNGGLDWADVGPRIEQALRELPEVEAVVFEPSEAAATQAAVRSADVPEMTPGRAALVALMDRYLAGLMDVSVSLLEVHKLMYFMQEAGEPLRLRFAKALYGPYAQNLRHVLIHVEGHMITGYSDGADRPTTALELVPGAVADATELLTTNPESRHHFERVTDLVQGFESPFGLELLSTVHWVARHEDVGTPERVVERVYAWNQRKRQFSSEQIRIAWEALRAKGWIQGAASPAA